MLTIVIPNRNRKLETVKRTLHSIAPQCIDQVKVVVVDYGSDPNYQKELEILITSLPHINLILCCTQGQLWNKCRVINMVLRSCETPYFMVVDMDMLFHPEFINKLLKIATKDAVHYFQVGVLSEEESKTEKSFSEYQVKFHTNDEATGITLFPTLILKQIQGFDEFYHGWGAEDTDVHVRLQNSDIPVYFYKEETLLLHQWHPKYYRSVKSTMPFHDTLEQINHRYLKLSRKLNKKEANVNRSWGILPDIALYEKLKIPDIEMHCVATEEEVKALVFQWSDHYNETLSFVIKPHLEQTAFKTSIKKILGKKLPHFMTMEEANKFLLENIVQQYRNCPYDYSFDRQKNEIKGTIYLKQEGL